MPCDTDKLIQAIVFANNKHGGVLELAKGCTYNLTRNDYEGNGLPVITEWITLKGEHTTILSGSHGRTTSASSTSAPVVTSPSRA